METKKIIIYATATIVVVSAVCFFVFNKKTSNGPGDMMQGAGDLKAASDETSTGDQIQTASGLSDGPREIAEEAEDIKTVVTYEGDIKIECTYEKDEKNITIKKCYKNGELFSRSNFSNYKKEGESKPYKECTYERDENNFTIRTCHKNGVLFSKKSFLNGRPEGGSKLYYDNGNLRQEFYTKKGKRNGAVRQYYNNGTLSYEANYINDRLNGVVADYYPDGKPKSEVHYRDGMLDGVAKMYYENGGPLEAKINYKSGKRDGVLTMYYKSGQAQEIIHFQNDVMEGEYKFYYEDGQLQEEGFYIEGELTDKKEYNIYGEFIFDDGTGGTEIKDAPEAIKPKQ